MKLIILGIALLGFISRTIANRSGYWTGRNWLGFVGRLAIGLSLVAAALWMAFQVDDGLTHDWPAAQRAGWVAAMFLLILVGVVRVIATLSHGADGESLDSPLWNNWLTLVTISTLVLGGAVLFAVSRGVPRDPTILMASGAYLVFFAIFPPQWTFPLMEVHWLGEWLGIRGMRWVQATFGIGSFGVGLYLMAGAT